MAVEWLLVTVSAAIILIAVAGVGLMVGCTPNGTAYSSGYTQNQWDAIHIGDSREAVRAALGEPLYTWSHPDDVWWSYSKQRTGTDDYLERKVRFSLNGYVTEKHEECYID